MKYLEAFNLFATIVIVIFTFFYLYQFIYIIYSIFHRKVPAYPQAKTNHRYAIFISARNEAGVIGELLDSLNNQNYPRDRFDIYVVADNCTDNTGDVAEKHGAVVYRRFDTKQVGKGYALNYLYHQIVDLKGAGYYDAFMVFDADNIVDPNFIREVNKVFDTGKFDAMTTYRNSKNFGQNWLTAAYSIWFMHEARHLNYPRSRLGAQCMISGTGFVVSGKVMEKNKGWPYYLMTEDIQFSVASTLNDVRIGYCDTAILYDEQPSTWKQAWKQRLRWAKGFYQIDARYIGKLFHAILTKKGRRWAAYDVLMTVLPASLLTIAMIFIAIWILTAAWFMPYYIRLIFSDNIGSYLFLTVLNYWLGMAVLAAVTIYMERDRIQEHNNFFVDIILFPLFIASYIPLAIEALFVKVKWTPIQHYSTKEIRENKNL
jgi:cellulose synthase/poly-beta-1,6-N-acetylglucosamine synthase-like glycosyltransferase